MNTSTDEVTNVNLSSPISLGDLTLSNRMIMAPLTRNRAAIPGNVPQAMVVPWKTERAY